MKRSTLPITLCLIACLPMAMPLQALAQFNPSEQAASSEAKPKTDKKRVFKAGGFGCVAGGALAYLTGKKDRAVAACAAAANAPTIEDETTRPREHAVANPERPSRWRHARHAPALFPRWFE